jgi:hypothetical protein
MQPVARSAARVHWCVCSPSLITDFGCCLVVVLHTPAIVSDRPRWLQVTRARVRMHPPQSVSGLVVSTETRPVDRSHCRSLLLLLACLDFQSTWDQHEDLCTIEAPQLLESYM